MINHMTQMFRDKESIVQLFRSQEEKIQRFGAKKLGLFGSFVRGEQNETSDIDILVEFLPGRKTYDNFIHLAFYLEELLQRDVDLLTPESLSPYLKPYIEQEVEYVSFAD